MIHAFRRVTLHDPQLPPEMLPSRWPAPAAYALCRDFYRLTQREPEQHLQTTLATHGDSAAAGSRVFLPPLRRTQNG